MWDDKARGYGAALTATFVKGKQASATNRESYNNSGAAISDASSEYMRAGLWPDRCHRVLAADKNVRLSGGVYNITDRKYWDYLSSRMTSASAQERNDINLAVMPGRTATGRERRLLITFRPAVAQGISRSKRNASTLSTLSGAERPAAKMYARDLAALMGIGGTAVRSAWATTRSRCAPIFRRC